VVDTLPVSSPSSWPMASKSDSRKATSGFRLGEPGKWPQGTLLRVRERVYVSYDGDDGVCGGHARR
jgi:hypothetical protein